MNKPKDIRAFFLPLSAYASDESLRLHNFFISTCFTTSFFATCYFFMSLYMHGFLFAENMAVSFVIFMIMPLLLRAGLPLSILANGFVTVIAVVACLQIYWDGGIRTANTAPWIILVPACAMMLQGIEAAISWLVVVLFIIAGFSYFTFEGVHFPIMYDASKDSLFNYLSLSGLVSLITVIFYISENERRKAHTSLQKQNETLDKLSKEKTKFLQIAAHDLRNPLLVIQGLADRSADADISHEERIECLNYIVSSTNRMSELIKNLLEIQVIEAGKMLVNAQPVSLTDLIKAYIVNVSHMPISKQAEIEVHMPDNNISIISDSARIEQILDNYVSNAIKYSPLGSKVYLYLTEHDEYIELRIKDEGPGIDQSEIDKLFKQFSIASSIPREGEHATGLGLAIVKKIADALGAEVGCDSENGKGCAFWVRFPKTS
jgi:signal transduction histidine kinase